MILEVKEVKVTEESFTVVKSKSPVKENEKSTRRVSMRLVKKKQDSCVIDRENVNEQVNGKDEGCNDFVDDDDDDDDALHSGNTEGVFSRLSDLPLIHVMTVFVFDMLVGIYIYMFW